MLFYLTSGGFYDSDKRVFGSHRPAPSILNVTVSMIYIYVYIYIYTPVYIYIASCIILHLTYDIMYYIGVKQSFLFLYYMYYVTAEIIIPQIINAYDSGENSKSAVRYLASAGHNVPVTLDAHTHVRNYLIVQMGVN